MQAIPPLVWILLGSIAMGVIIGVPYVLIRRWWRRRNGLPPDEASPERVADTTRLRPAHAGWAALVAGGVALAWFSAWPMDWGRITLHTVLLTAMWLVATYMVIKGRPTTSRTLKELALCSPLCVFGLLCFINQRADTSVARRYEVRVLAIEASKWGGVCGALCRAQAGCVLTSSRGGATKLSKFPWAAASKWATCMWCTCARARSVILGSRR